MESLCLCGMWRAELTISRRWKGVVLPELGVCDMVGVDFFGFARGGGLSETGSRVFVLVETSARWW